MVGWDGIVGMGINKMGRVHIHFSTQVPDSLKPHWEVIVQVDIKEAQQDGNEEGTLPAKYISFAQHLDSGEYMNLDPSVSLHDDDESIEAEHSDLICEIGSSCNSVNEVMCVHQDTPQVSQQSGNWSDSTGDGVSEIENDPPPGYREATREPGDETSGSDLDNTLVKGMQDSKGDPENEEGVVTVCRLRSGSVFRVPVKVQGQSLFAVVDTAAEVTLISEEVYKSLKVVPPVLKEVIMHTAGRGMQMNGFIVGPTEIQLGARVMEANIYVAPISDDMLLGFDLLREEGVALDMLEGHLKIGDEVIPMTSGAVGQVPREANVLLDKTVTVPPNSVMRVSCNLSNELSGYVVEACTHDELLVPRTLQAPGRHPIICLMNISDKHVTIPENEMIARAIEVEILPGTELGLAQGNDPWVCKVEGEDHSLVEEGVPNHSKDLFDKSKTDLDTDGQKQLASLLSDFGDVFAANEFDLGNFSLIEHHIDTGDHPPIKQRMRRTPVGFAQEEEAHLKRMLEAGVIQPSVSEWCSAPVLVHDILVLGQNLEAHFANLRAVLQRFREFGLKLKPKKCELFQKKVEFLGRVVGEGGMEIGPGYIEDVKNWPTPNNSKDIERFLGFANYHRSFIHAYSKIAVPLQEVTGKRPLRWETEQQESFDKLKMALTSAPVLALPNATDPFILDCDASDKSLGAELIQVQEGKERVVAYSSLTLAPEQQRY
ncbi:Hypothetical predicted protein, partial [Mytilus galloprovincialis]